MNSITGSAVESQSVQSSRWRLVVLCFLAQNCAMGVAYGSFGPLLASTEQHFGVSRSLASAGMSVLSLAIGGLSPLLGNVMQRTPVRLCMVVGALASAVGYGGLAVLTWFPAALVMYGLIGAGVCITAVLGPMTLVTRNVESNRGRILGIVNLPIMLFLTPYATAALLPMVGRFAILAGLTAIFLVLAPLLLLIVERPPSGEAQPSTKDAAAGMGARMIWGNPAFWMLSLGIAIFAGTGTAFYVHIVPYAVGQSMSLQAGSGLLSAYAGAGILGSLLFGWIADRIGPPAALILSAFGQAAMWWSMLHVNGALLYLSCGLLGICIFPMVTLLGAALGDLFDADTFSRAIGYSYSFLLPFSFGFPLLVGLAFEHFGSYSVPFLLIALSLVVAGVFFALMVVLGRKQQRLSAPAAR